MAEQTYLEPVFDFDSLQFLDNPEMQPLFSDNFFPDSLMEDNFTTSLLGLPTDLIEETAHISGSKIFTEDANVYLPGDLDQCFATGKNVQQQTNSAINSRSKSDMTVIRTGTCVLPVFLSDLAFVERAVQYSSFGRENYQIAEESALNTTETITSVKGKERAFEPDVSGNDNNYSPLKKRKTVQAVYTEAAKGNRWKGEDNVKDAIGVSKHCPEKTKKGNSVKTYPAPVEKPNSMHVRARRGEAIDRYSLAERERRKKISEHMKILQDLVPGCSKITSKALILEEIINHVQFLHRQVEFLSMKTAIVNPRFDISAKDINTGYPPNGGISAETMSSPYHHNNCNHYY